MRAFVTLVRQNVSSSRRHARRVRKSPWSLRNKTRVEVLRQQGRLTPAGVRVIERAREDGSWTALDLAEQRVVPDDLLQEFGSASDRAVFERLAPSRQRNILQWIATAKRPQTRRRRIQQTVDAASRGQAPHPF